MPDRFAIENRGPLKSSKNEESGRDAGGLREGEISNNIKAGDCELMVSAYCAQ